MILHCNFEELRALASGVELYLTEHDSLSHGSVAAPPRALAEVKQLQPRLAHSLSILTLAEQRVVRKAISAVCDELRDRLDEKVVQYHPAHEEAVALYFDYAHALGVLSRLDEIGTEMTGLIELMNGGVTDEAAATVEFPD